MSTDIHLHCEIRVDGEWLHYNHPCVKQDYALFAKMAGVRNDDYWFIPLATPRGFPGDATKTTCLDYERYGDDAHNASWLNAQEICTLECWYETVHLDGSGYDIRNWTWGYLFGNDYQSFVDPECKGEYPAFLEDVRFVFWFDN